MRRFPRSRQSGVAILLILVATVFASSAQPADDEAGTYALEPGDQIEVRVFGHPEFTIRLRVPPSGQVSFPTIRPITLRGQTIGSVEREVTTQLKERGILKQPLVTVVLLEFAPRSVYVLGSVTRAGEYPIPIGRDLLLSHAISMAGGFDENADLAHVRILRTGDGAGESLEIDFREVESARDKSLNLKLRNGDQILVPELKSVYVMGEVRQPGRIRLPSDTKLTVSRVIASAGGLTERTADSSEVRIIRKTATGTETIEVDVLSHLEGKSKTPEPEVEPDDLIYVPRRGVF